MIDPLRVGLHYEIKENLVAVRLPMYPIVLKNGQKVMRFKRKGSSFTGVSIDYNDDVYKGFDLVKTLLMSFKCELRRKGMLPLWPGKLLNAQIISAGAWKQGSESRADASNLYQFIEDALEKNGIIANDNVIESHDGSARICLCDLCNDKDIYKVGEKKGQLKPECRRRKQVVALTKGGRAKTNRKTGNVKKTMSKCPHAFIQIRLTPKEWGMPEILGSITCI